MYVKALGSKAKVKYMYCVMNTCTIIMCTHIHIHHLQLDIFHKQWFFVLNTMYHIQYTHDCTCTHNYVLLMYLDWYSTKEGYALTQLTSSIVT